LIELARPAIADLEITISNLATLTTGLSEGRDRLKSIVENVSSIVEKVDRSEGLLGMLITDRNAADDFSVLMTKARGTAEHAEVAAKSLAVFTADLPELSSKVQVSVDRVEAILGNFQDGSQSFKEAMESLPGIMEKGGSALDEASVIIRNVKEASTDLPEITSRGRRVVRSADELLTAVGRNRLIRGVLSLEEEEEIVEVQISDQRDTAYPH
jgi:ABC-type transporter Mla subunit MlaD